jgi:DNA invertase Pin-like site-specific DNA recombinase
MAHVLGYARVSTGDQDVAGQTLRLITLRFDTSRLDIVKNRCHRFPGGNKSRLLQV